MTLKLAALLLIALSCEDSYEPRQNKPSESDEDVEGYVSETIQYLPAEDAAVVVHDNTTVEILAGTTNIDSQIRIRRFAEPPADNPTIEMGSAVGDVVNVSFLSADDASVLGSSILEKTFYINQAVAPVGNEDDIKMVVVTDPGTKGEKTNVLGSNAISLEWGEDGALTATMTASIEAGFTNATVWLVESASTPEGIVIGSSGVLKSKEETPAQGEPEENEVAKPVTVRVVYDHAGVTYFATIVGGEVVKTLTHAGEYNEVIPIFRDGKEPDFVASVTNQRTKYFSHSSPGTWTSSSVRSGGGDDINLSAVPISETASAIFIDDSAGGYKVYLWDTIAGLQKSIDSHASSSCATSTIGKSLAAFGDNYLVQSCLDFGTFVWKLNSEETNFVSITSGVPAPWKDNLDNDFDISMKILPYDGEHIIAMGNFDTIGNGHYGLVKGNVNDASYAYYPLGQIPSGEDNYNFGNNSQGDIVAAYSQSADSMKVFVKTKTANSFTELPKLQYFITAGRIGFGNFEVRIDNLGDVHVVYFDRVELVYKKYSAGAWSEPVVLIAAPITPGKMIQGVHIDGTPSGGGIR